MHTPEHRLTHTRIRPARTLAASLIPLLYTGIAFAADTPTPQIPGYAAAQQMIHSSEVRDSVSRFLNAAGQSKSAAADGGNSGTPLQETRAVADRDSVHLRDPAPLYEITPDFLTDRGTPSRQTAFRLIYLVSQASVGVGQKAAVLLTPGSQASSWDLASIREGDAETRLAARATDGSQVFTEPQIHAWYRLTRDDHVQPLNPEAVTSLGRAQSVTLTDYQKLVQGRYANKMPGTTYDRRGLAGGFNPTASDTTTTAADNVSRSGHGRLSTAMLSSITAVVALSVASGATLLFRRKASPKTT